MSLRQMKTADDSVNAVPRQEEQLEQWSPAQLAQKQVKESNPANGESQTAGWNPAEVWRDRIKR